MDVAIVGTGPNGLSAGVTLARAGLKVELFEAADSIGGGLRTHSLFDSEVTHDICAAIHPMAASSFFFRTFDLPARGVELLSPEISYAHPLDGGRAGLAHRDLVTAAAHLGPDGPNWWRLMRPLLDHSEAIVDMILFGQRRPPRDLRAAALLATRVIVGGTRMGAARFTTEEARSLLGGVAAHAMGKLPSLASGAVAMLLGHLAHGVGWPIPRGGSARIAEAMATDILAHGGVFHTEHMIKDIHELKDYGLVFFDTSMKGFLSIAGDRLPYRYSQLLLNFRYGPGAAKVDFLVSEPIPWANAQVGKAGTVHLGGTYSEMVQQETATARGIATAEPFVLVVDPAVADLDRARPGKRPIWAYAHVPNGDTRGLTHVISQRIERYAPGFRDTIVAARGISASDYESYNANYVGGDIGSGAMTLYQAIARPVPRLDPYKTPIRGIYLCSAATPPGPSVHGMSGYLAALSALRREYGLSSPPSLSPQEGVSL
ncbi:NAD(P)/FAD-dependent oxidoreductase [Nonomuraea sp. NPDC005650]|uniref:phytoene desaturase family protein n=1 Tax=Nonomuraea sp. NPDC005650 TaxID=3157045 RepID=UPI0033A488E8